MTRCPAALWLRAHDATWRQARDAAGRAVAPHSLIWACARCGRALGVTQVHQVDARRRDSGGEIPLRPRFSGRENAPPRVVALHPRRQAKGTMTARHLALYWWIDRWRKSTAFIDMTLEEQGAYRNLLDEATLRGGAIPDNPEVLAKACGDPRRWAKVRAVVLARFTLTPEGWRHETLDAVLRETDRRAEKQRTYRTTGHKSGNGGGNAAGNATG